MENFKVVAKDQYKWMLKIKDCFHVKPASAPNYYLGNNYFCEEKEQLWTYKCNKYLDKAVRHCEATSGTNPYQKTPPPSADCHPELDTSNIMTLEEHRCYQQLLGMECG